MIVSTTVPRRNIPSCIASCRHVGVFEDGHDSGYCRSMSKLYSAVKARLRAKRVLIVISYHAYYCYYTCYCNMLSSVPVSPVFRVHAGFVSVYSQGRNSVGLKSDRLHSWMV